MLTTWSPQLSASLGSSYNQIGFTTFKLSERSSLEQRLALKSFKFKITLVPVIPSTYNCIFSVKRLRLSEKFHALYLIRHDNCMSHFPTKDFLISENLNMSQVVQGILSALNKHFFFKLSDYALAPLASCLVPFSPSTLYVASAQTVFSEGDPHSLSAPAQVVRYTGYG